MRVFTLTTFAMVTTALFTTYAAIACEPANVVISPDGSATWIVPERNDRADMELIFGSANAATDLLVIDSRNSSGTWVPASALVSDLQVAFGIESHGFTYRGPDHCTPPGMPIDLPETDKPEPEELFPDQLAATCTNIVRDGTWQAIIGETKIEGCPVMMQQAFAMSPAAQPAFDTKPRALAFSCPFDPNGLELSQTTGVRWQQDGERSWSTKDLGAAQFAQIPQGEGGGSHILWTLSVQSPDLITFERTVNIILPAEASAVLGTSPEGCRVTGSDRWVRIGD